MFHRWVLSNSKDQSHIAPLELASSKQLNLVHNKAGSASYQFPMNAEYADYITTYSTGLKCYRYDWRASLLAGVPIWRNIWSGYNLTIDEDATNNKMTVNVVGWLQRLDRRIIRRLNGKSYAYAPGTNPPATATAYDDGAIVLDLLTEANLSPQPDGYVPTIPAGSSPNTSTWMTPGTTLPNEGPGGATPYTPNYIGKTWPMYQNILAALDEITSYQNGCDFYVDPDTRTLNVYRKKMVDRTGAVFGFNWGPNNLAQFGRQIDGSVAVNYELVSGNSGTGPKYQDDIPSQAKYNLIEEQTALSDVVDPLPPAQSILQTYASAEVALRADPGRIVYSLTPFAYVPGGGVPEPFVDYNVSDRVYLSANYPPRIKIQGQAVRLFGMTVDVDDEGNEKLGQLQVSP